MDLVSELIRMVMDWGGVGGWGGVGDGVVLIRGAALNAVAAKEERGRTL